MGIIPPVYLFSKTPCEGVIHVPLLQTRFLSPKIDFTRYDLLVATSKSVFDALGCMDSAWKKLPLLAVSEATAEAARAAGVEHVEIAGGNGSDVAQRIKALHAHQRILYPCAREVATDFADRLRDEGIAIEKAVVYETVCDASVLPDIIEADAVLVFTSPSAVTCFLSKMDFAAGQRLVAIGETTRKAFPAGAQVLLSERPSVREAVELAKRVAAQA